MKHTIPLLAALLVASAQAAPPRPTPTPKGVPVAPTVAPHDAVAFWNVVHSERSGENTVIPDTVGGNDIVLNSDSGAKVEVDAKAPGGKAVVFDGSQAKPANSKKSFKIADGLRVTLLARPSVSPTDATLVYFFGSLELRYYPKKGQLGLIVWYGGTDQKAPFTQIVAPILPDEWNKIEASVKDRELQLTVNGQTVKGQLPENTFIQPTSNMVAIGCGSDRPFLGALTDIAVLPAKD